MTDVFISYSRKDKEFVKVLHQALLESQHDAWIDWEDIPITADWWEEIKTGIEASDTFIFVISPDSILSKVCGEEIDYAVANNKRLLPIVRRDGFDLDKVRPALGKHNWLFFREEDDFGLAFQTLVKALDTDLVHVKQHTRILVRAIEWDKKAQNESFVLRGSDLEEAEQWLQSATTKIPQPTDLQIQYIDTSRKVEVANQILLQAGQKANRMIRIGVGVLGATLGTAAIAGILATQRIQAANQQVYQAEEKVKQIREDAQKRTQLAKQSVEVAEERRKQAEVGVSLAKQNLTIAQRNLNQVNEEARQRIELATRGVRKAEAQVESARRVQRQAEAKVRQAQSSLHQAQSQLKAEQENLQLAQAGTQLEQVGASTLRQFQSASTEKIGVLIAAMQAGRELERLAAHKNLPLGKYPATSPLMALQTILDNPPQQLQFKRSGIQARREAFTQNESVVTGLSFSPDGQYRATARQDGTVLVCKIDNQHCKSFTYQNPLANLSFTPDSTTLMGVGQNGSIQILRITGHQEQSVSLPVGIVTGFSISRDGKWLATINGSGIVQLWAWDWQKFQFLSQPVEIKNSNGGILDVSFSHNSQHLATAEPNGLIRLWDLSGQSFAQFNSYQDLRQVRFSPDGEVIATIGLDDGTLKLWSLSGKQIAQYGEVQNRVVNASFNSTGKQLAIAFSDGSVQLQPIRDLRELLAEGCELLRNSLSYADEASQVCKTK